MILPIARRMEFCWSPKQARCSFIFANSHDGLEERSGLESGLHPVTVTNFNGIPLAQDSFNRTFPGIRTNLKGRPKVRDSEAALRHKKSFVSMLALWEVLT